MIALPLALVAAATALLYRWLDGAGWSRGERLRWALAWAPALAFGVPSCGFFLARWCGIDGVLPWSLTSASVVALLELAVRGKRRNRHVATLPAAVADTPGRANRALGAAAALLLAITALELSDSFRTWSRAQPDGMWDAVAIWNAGARFLVRADAERLPELFGALREGHPEYPLLLAAGVAAQWELAGVESTAVPLGMSLGFAIGLAAALHLLVRTSGSALFAVPAVLLVFSTPAVWKWAFAQVADLPLAYLAVAAALPLAAALEGRLPSPPPVLSGFVLGLLPWVKSEGALMAATLVGLFLALRFVGRERLRTMGDPPSKPARRVLLYALGALPGLLSLALFKLTWAPPVPDRASFLRSGGKVAALLDGERWRLVAKSTLNQVDPATGAELWGWSWALLAVGLLFWGARLGRRASPGAVLLASTATVICCLYALAFVLSPFDLAWHLGSALDRLLLHVLPLLTAAVFALAGERATPATPDRPV